MTNRNPQLEVEAQTRLELGCDVRRCSSCNAEAVDGELVADCLHDLEREDGYPVGGRPRSCVNRHDPRRAGIPY